MIYNYNKLYIYICILTVYIHIFKSPMQMWTYNISCGSGYIYIYTSICQIISIVAISTCAEVSMIFSCYQKGEPAGSIADQYHCLIG